jgi:hypothetical protein
LNDRLGLNGDWFLSCIYVPVGTDLPEFQQDLERFFSRWRRDALVGRGQFGLHRLAFTAGAAKAYEPGSFLLLLFAGNVLALLFGLFQP